MKLNVEQCIKPITLKIQWFLCQCFFMFLRKSLPWTEKKRKLYTHTCICTSTKWHVAYHCHITATYVKVTDEDQRSNTMLWICFYQSSGGIICVTMTMFPMHSHWTSGRELQEHFLLQKFAKMPKSILQNVYSMPWNWMGLIQNGLKESLNW